MPQRENPLLTGFPLGQGIFATVWPAVAPIDSKSLRRRKFAVRAGHLAMILMVLFSVGTAIVADHSNFSAASLTFLGMSGACYVLWNLVGTQGIVTLVLWEKAMLPPAEIRIPRCGALIYFTVQVALAGLVYYTADHGRAPNLIWLVLLPPVAYAVFLLE